MRISDWSSDVCSSELAKPLDRTDLPPTAPLRSTSRKSPPTPPDSQLGPCSIAATWKRSEEHTSELQSLMRISYAVFCLKKKTINKKKTTHTVYSCSDKHNYSIAIRRSQKHVRSQEH